MTTVTGPELTDDLAIQAVRGRASAVGAADDYDPLLELIGDARFVLLGEASHGTHEFYRERAQITKRLIREKGFTAVAVEADWPDAYRVNRYVRGRGDDADAIEALAGFRRFPDLDVAQRRRARLRRLAARPQRRVPAGHGPRSGFYGLDLYSLHASMEAVLAYLDKVDPEAAERARAPLRLLRPLRRGPPGLRLRRRARARPVLRARGHQPARRPAPLAPPSMRVRDGRIAEDDYFYAEQNARLVRDAEQYYRTMFRGEVSSWNLRDRHMAETLDALVDYLGQRGGIAKVVVWAHNSHLGDARATQMGGAGRVERRPARARAVRPRRGPGRLHHLSTAR